VGGSNLLKEGKHIVADLFEEDGRKITQDSPFNCDMCNLLFTHREQLLPLTNLIYDNIKDIVKTPVRVPKHLSHDTCCPRSKNYFSVSTAKRFKDRSQRSGQPYYPTPREVLEERHRYLLLHKSLNDESILVSSVRHWDVELPAVTYMGVELPATKDPGMYEWYKNRTNRFDELYEYDKLCFLQIPDFWINLIPEFERNHWENIRLIKLKIENSKILCTTFIGGRRKKGIDKHMHNYFEGYLTSVRSATKRTMKYTYPSMKYSKLPPNMKAALTEMRFFDLYDMKLSSSARTMAEVIERRRKNK